MMAAKGTVTLWHARERRRRHCVVLTKDRENKTTMAKTMKISRNRSDALRYIKEVEVAFQSNRKKYDEFLKIVKDLNLRSGTRISIRVIKAKVERLFKGHSDLILGFNTLLPKEYQIMLPQRTGKKVKRVKENCELPWDVLDIISKRLDFDDLYFSLLVCARIGGLFTKFIGEIS
ncbi:paired amphipathic helix protein Sin3-like 1 isoform X1 [Trifolium pratense]|uniref:paired amphipathic helix protein Sin3-like 1 isoform X1 n=2 Tax=Trifolium pratense TaxID=57577 RepID=UPI001E694F35|nr:paired amphipathic helix protein Sin3-like 1 isoform X1 [Trifolium pratense]